jgi:hypothetical protein
VVVKSVKASFPTVRVRVPAKSHNRWSGGLKVVIPALADLRAGDRGRQARTPTRSAHIGHCVRQWCPLWTLRVRRPAQNQAATHDLRIAKSDTDQQLYDFAGALRRGRRSWGSPNWSGSRSTAPNSGSASGTRTRHPTEIESGTFANAHTLVDVSRPRPTRSFTLKSLLMRPCSRVFGSPIPAWRFCGYSLSLFHPEFSRVWGSSMKECGHSTSWFLHRRVVFRPATTRWHISQRRPNSLRIGHENLQSGGDRAHLCGIFRRRRLS